MIKVSKTSNSIALLGHANYAPMGQDIVCAAISVLIQNLIQSIETLTNDTIKYDMKPGEVHINYENLSDHAQILIDSFFMGVVSIAETYPENVQIEQACNS